MTTEEERERIQNPTTSNLWLCSGYLLGMSTRRDPPTAVTEFDATMLRMASYWMQQELQRNAQADAMIADDSDTPGRLISLEDE